LVLDFFASVISVLPTEGACGATMVSCEQLFCQWVLVAYWQAFVLGIQLFFCACWVVQAGVWLTGLSASIFKGSVLILLV